MNSVISPPRKRAAVLVRFTPLSTAKIVSVSSVSAPDAAVTAAPDGLHHQYGPDRDENHRPEQLPHADPHDAERVQQQPAADGDDDEAVHAAAHLSRPREDQRADRDDDRRPEAQDLAGHREVEAIEHEHHAKERDRQPHQEPRRQGEAAVIRAVRLTSLSPHRARRRWSAGPSGRPLEARGAAAGRRTRPVRVWETGRRAPLRAPARRGYPPSSSAARAR